METLEEHLMRKNILKIYTGGVSNQGNYSHIVPHTGHEHICSLSSVPHTCTVLGAN